MTTTTAIAADPGGAPAAGAGGVANLIANADTSTRAGDTGNPRRAGCRRRACRLSYGALIEAAKGDPADGELLEELHRRDRAAGGHIAEDPSCLDHLLDYPDALLSGLIAASGGWAEYRREASRRHPLGGGGGPAPRSFADAAREWAAADARLRKLDRELRSAFGAGVGGIIVGGELWQLDPRDGSIARSPIRHGERIPLGDHPLPAPSRTDEDVPTDGRRRPGQRNGGHSASGTTEVHEKSRLLLVIKRDDQILATDPITGAVHGEFRSMESARSWSGGLVPFADRRGGEGGAP